MFDTVKEVKKYT